MPRWMHERKNEHYYQKAKQEGYRSRASYKLKQLNDEYHFFKNTKKVLDLGAAPGGWLQVASEALNNEGLVIGVDLKEIEPLEMDNIETIQGDATDPEVQNEILERFNGKVDLILSDMAPNVTGIWEVDDLRQIYLARIALVIADKLLKTDGWMVVKVFMGPEHESFIQDMRNVFEKLFIVKPKASRKSSAEIYLVAKNLKPKRILPSDFNKNIEEVILDEEDEGPIPGDQLPFIEEKKITKQVH
ncbi:RlmE family RNA methyltransferase [Candidatus Bathyarchaeota archaeon]|nr:RlmE family RNA methyltransferase [Candidatus Bathyarchaeota archaeon]